MASVNAALAGSYDYRLVILSVCISVLASYAALDLAGRLSPARGRFRLLSLIGGAAAMGIGIWSMHYIGMLAFRLAVPVEYDWPTVLLSLLAAVFASGVALFVVSRPKMGAIPSAVGSLFMGGGIAAMHYVGMAAMRLPAMCLYSTALVALSIALAVVISFAALWLTFHFRDDSASGGWLKFLSALIMGAAIPVMHYTGMAAVTFIPATLGPQELAHAVSVSLLGGAGIAIVTFMVLALVILTSFMDRRFSVQATELQSSEQSYRQIIECALDAFIEIDNRGRIVEWNAQAEAALGWSRAEAVGKTIYETILPGRLGEETHRLVADLSAAHESSIGKRIETVRVHKDGHEIPVELSVSLVRAGGHSRLCAFVRDITERKRSESEVVAAKEAAEAGSRAKSEFLANMSHEIRTPLNGVIGMTDLALGTELNAEQREYLETVKLSADSLLTVINHILDFSKIEAGKVELEIEDFNLRDTLEGILKTLALRAGDKGLELLCDIAPEVPEVVRGDASRLRQVLVNLLGNAIKFTHSGEVELSVRVQAAGKADSFAAGKADSSDTAGKADASDAAAARDSMLHFTVSDSGIGIAPDKSETVFQAFAQADSSTTRKFGGTGLGLSISKRLVELMNGKIWLESEPGRGTQFHFTAVLCKSAAPVAEISVATAELLRNLKVLIVDDNRTNRRILEAMLKRWEMRSTSVADARAAIAQLSSAAQDAEPFDLILTDLHMPNTDGFSLVEQIRQLPELATATIIMLTSAGHRGDGARCQELGVAGYLLKPIRQSELHEAIAQALGSRAQPGPLCLITRHSLKERAAPAVSLRILVAEDNPVNQLLATRLLQKKGHRVVMTANGRQALEALAKDTYDLVFMDVQMPEMDGLEATAAIREREQRDATGVHLPVIALTAHAVKGDEARCLAAGMDGYLAKPIQLRDLDDILAKYAPTANKSAPLSETASEIASETASEIASETGAETAAVRP